MYIFTKKKKIFFTSKKNTYSPLDVSINFMFNEMNRKKRKEKIILLGKNHQNTKKKKKGFFFPFICPIILLTGYCEISYDADENDARTWICLLYYDMNTNMIDATWIYINREREKKERTMFLLNHY